MTGSTGLLTPGLSPPQVEYLSPMLLERKPGASIEPVEQHADGCFLTPSLPTPAYRTPEVQQSDDEEMICLKLLGHLKKTSYTENSSVDDMMSTLKKSTAVIRRILKSKNARSDYSCLLLISNILMKVVEICEKASQRQFAEPSQSDAQFLTNFDENFCNESEQGYYYADLQSDYSSSVQGERLRDLLERIAELCAEVGGLLKNKPLNGFQTIGRHEGLHVDLGRRLQICLNLL